MFTAREITETGGFPTSVHAGDLDGDGDIDVVATAPGEGSVVLYENKGPLRNSAFAPHVMGAVRGASSVFVLDLDDDGDLDVVSAGQEGRGQIWWHENDGALPPSFTTHAVPGQVVAPRSVTAADLDGDGDVDLLSASLADDKIAWYKNDGAMPPLFTQHVITEDPDPRGPGEGFANGAILLIAADVDSDGDVDIVFAAVAADIVGWYENDGGRPPTFSPHIVAHPLSTGVPPYFDGPTSVFAADVDRDGNLDILTASGNDDRIAWHENDGGSPPSFTLHTITLNADTAISVHAADFDLDGDVDIVAASRDDDGIFWYENDGGSPPSFTEHVLSHDPDGLSGPAVGFADSPRAVFAADLDSDGDPDILSASADDSTVAWFENRVDLPGGRPRR
jgi:hypothetical protein